jgi:tetratricopeptide (TPR) repeat protein
MVAVLLLALPIAAQPLGDKERTEQARAHFEMGKAHFNLGEYEAAVREFEAGYRLKPQPLFLYNLGNAARRAGQAKKALDAFRSYLAERPQAPERRDVLQRIEELQQKLAEPPAPSPEPQPQEPQPEPTPQPQPQPQTPQAQPQPQTPQPQPQTPQPQPPQPQPQRPQSPQPQPQPQSSWRRDWLGATLCAVGGSVILYGAIDFAVYYPRFATYASAPTFQEHWDAVPAARDAAPHLNSDLVLMPLGAAMVVAGAIRYAVLARRR